MGAITVYGYTIHVGIEVVYLVALLVVCIVVIVSDVYRTKTGGGGWDK